MLWLAGLALLALVSTRPEGWSRAGRAGLAFGLGLVAVCHALFVASWLGLAPSPWTGLAVTASLWGLALVVRGPRAVRDGLLASGLASGGTTQAPARGSLALEGALAMLVAAVCALVGGLALAEPLVEWDVLAIWAYKARVLLVEPVSATALLTDPSRAYSHLDYPLLWPFTLAWVWTAAGPDVLAVKALAPATFVSFALVFHALLRRGGADRSTALWFTALLVLTPMWRSQSVRLMADVPLAWFASASGGCLFLWLRGRCDDGVRLAGLFACGMLLTKNEGIALYAVWLLATAVACTALCDARGRRAAALWLALVPAVVTAPWFAVRAGIPQLHEDYVSRLAPAVWWENVERIPTLAAGAWSYMREPADWLLLWPALALLLAGSVRVWRRRPELLFLLALAELPLLLYAGVFVITPWEPRVLLEAAAGRLLLHTFPLQLLLAAEITRSAGWLPWLRPAANAAGDAYRVGPTASEA